MNELSEMFENNLTAPGPYNMSGILDLPMFSINEGNGGTGSSNAVDSDTASVVSQHQQQSQQGATAPLMIQSNQSQMYSNLPTLSQATPGSDHTLVAIDS